MMTPSEPKAGEASIFGISRCEERVELADAVVDRLAVRLAVLAAVGKDQIEVRHVAGREGVVEDVHRPVGLVARIDVVVEALLRLRRLRPDTADALDVVVVDRRVPGRVEAGQGAGALRRAASARAGVAPRRAALEPRLPREVPDVELVVDVVYVLMARGAIVLLLAAVELAGSEGDVVRLRPMRCRAVVREPGGARPQRPHHVGGPRRIEMGVRRVFSDDEEDVPEAGHAFEPRGRSIGDPCARRSRRRKERGGCEQDAEERTPCHAPRLSRGRAVSSTALDQRRLFSSRSTWRFASRSAMSRRLSRCSLPRASATSTFTFPSLK